MIQKISELIILLPEVFQAQLGIPTGDKEWEGMTLDKRFPTERPYYVSMQGGF